MRTGAQLAVATVVVVGAGAALWAIVRSPPPAPAATPAPEPAHRADPPPAPDAALRIAPIAPAVRPADPDPAAIAPPSAGGFAAWTGLEGTRPGELEATAAAQGVPFDVARESRRLLWLVEVSRNRPRVGELAGRPVADATWTAAERAGADALRTGAQLVDDLRAGTVDAPTCLGQLRAVEAEYRADFARRTGLTDAQIDQLFDYQQPGAYRSQPQLEQ